MKRAQTLIRENRLTPIQVGLLEADLQEANARKRTLGETALRELGLDVERIDYAIDEETGAILQVG
jgi:hypothetical protein